MKMYRQGDVLVMEVVGLPNGAAETPSDEAERLVLAHGEVTGHAHAIDINFVTQYLRGDEVYIATSDGAVLRHEEHSPIPLPKGFYRVIRQREYTPDFLRRVCD